MSLNIFSIKKLDNNSIVEPLSNYYSILAQCDYTTGRPLMLDKNELLRKYIIINVVNYNINNII